jgi:hypothetical protein
LCFAVDVQAAPECAVGALVVFAGQGAGEGAQVLQSKISAVTGMDGF